MQNPTINTHNIRRNFTIHVLVLALAVTTLSSCGASPKALDGRAWQGQLGHHHPLLGRIWDRRAGRFISRANALQQVRTATYVLLGELHDNHDHHRLQAWFLREIVRSGRRPAVVFEMFDSSQQTKISRWRRSQRANADQTSADQANAAPPKANALAAAVDWSHSGWPPFALYHRIVQTALDANLVVAAANLPRRRVRAIAMGAALTAKQRRHLGLDGPLPEGQERRARLEVVAAHCGMVPASSAGPMVLAQRARDGAMARAMLAYPGGQGTVLIAGNGHVRSDRGVPYLLRRWATTSTSPSKTVAVQFVEVPAALTETDAAAIGMELGGDLLVFTARRRRVDPCLRYRARGRRAK